MLIKSQVKYIQSLSQKKVRDEDGVFVAEGPKIINELLAGGEVQPVAVYATPDWDKPPGLNTDSAAVIQEISVAELDRISFLTTPNQVLAIFKKPAYHGISNHGSSVTNNSGTTSTTLPNSLTTGVTARDLASVPGSSITATDIPSVEGNGITARDLASVEGSGLTARDLASVPGSGLTLMLDTIQDPGNLGTIIRCADWFGVKTIICSPESADNFSPKVVQSTMASIVRVEVIYTNLSQYLENNPGLPIYAAALNGKPLESFKTVNKGILIIGNESRGISPEILALATDLITIPRIGKAESLNAAVATGIILATFTTH